MQTNLMKFPFGRYIFSVKLNLNRLSVCLRDVVSKRHQMTSSNAVLLIVGALDHVVEMRSLFGQLRCALFLSRQ